MAARAPRAGARVRGENAELRADLNSQYRDPRKEAIKRVIASMTVGKDVSGLFPDVLKNMQTDDIEQKKLVYLYLQVYAKTQPELVILAVNTFVKDTEDPNPLIRALAIRTMSCLRAEKILDYIADPLRKCLRDENPYVRKTAAICVVKLYDMKPSLAVENGFITALQEMVTDSNPMVVANAVLALTEIQESAEDERIFELDSSTLARLLVALGECTEWGRIAILGAVAKYTPEDEKEAEHICERVIPQFQHANGSVVLAAIKVRFYLGVTYVHGRGVHQPMSSAKQVIMIHLKYIHHEEFTKGILRKMAPPLVTLVSSAPEVQWVALRNINLILQKRPDALSNEMRVFFCKYNDPPYVKVEKLEIMIKLVTEKNVDTFLSELKECVSPFFPPELFKRWADALGIRRYASEVDVDFVRKSIRAIGQCAVKIEAAAERCVNVLLDLISTRVSYVVQESIVVIKDIFRRYPQRYEGIIPTLCASLDELDEPEAKASLIWILGEYASKIDNADELIGSFLDNYADEPVQVQLQALTAVVKLFLQRPDQAQALVQRVLALATKTADSADLRDRAYIQWRLLSSDTEVAKAVILAARPPISLPTTTVPVGLLDELISELGALSAVYHKPVQAFVAGGKLGADQISASTAQKSEATREAALATLVAGQKAENVRPGALPLFACARERRADDACQCGGREQLLDFDDDEPTADEATADLFAPPSNANTSSNPLDDLLGLFGAPPPAASSPNPASLLSGSSIPHNAFASLNLNSSSTGPSPAAAAHQPASTNGGGEGNGLDDLLF
ncbi:SPOSA6832_03471 [Sporobolomyces salmonicolor]|uniref:AP complex subunit beta n=1 Tax=Sporidiobolus salmonicolor TaxID=5005 RepID=A0A0D6EPL5_SPOSA|nr:SPOSA6832_03471 [Sporobolomyces salmonicolor]